jgi:hypothetical protein
MTVAEIVRHDGPAQVMETVGDDHQTLAWIVLAMVAGR